MPIVRLRKALDQPPPTPAGSMPLCTLDQGHPHWWLRLHQRCFLTGWAPAWDDDDFRREFLERPWWDARRMAFAVTPSRRHAIGTVTVAGAAGPTLHIAWLAVDPRYRRRHVGRQLLAWAERTCWELGGRTLTAETLATWREAVAFYRALGYR